jgi:hypothetical protein
LLAGCGDPTPMMVEPPRFTSDAVSDGAALFTRGELLGRELQLTVLAKELGPVLGYAFTVELEGLAFDGEPVAEAALGPNAFGEAVYLAKTGPASLAVGAARQGAAAGERTLDGETALARMKLALGEGPSRVRLVRPSVRRANGDGVVVALSGGGVR